MLHSKSGSRPDFKHVYTFGICTPDSKTSPLPRHHGRAHCILPVYTFGTNYEVSIENHSNVQ
ncbi:hypothetical protein E2C01_046348 [Portunus trituberculatus]|uniref:Uncharacterized protein n=1 Tax=Portunus trituberculatus TaxID=210409 RepID=A0A5B7G5R8_PORTR|nr:hypothetical protein [Portunus trituberculatus]